MPEFTVAHIAILALLFATGALLGWISRSDRCAREKIAVNAGWQEQLESRQSDNRRLEAQNRKLMQRISEFQASHRDSQQRTKDLTDTLKQAVDRRDELNRQVQEVRKNLQSAVEERDRLRAEERDRATRDEAAAHALRDRDKKIFRLSRELTSWQSRLPPLVAKFRERDLDVRELRAKLEEAEQVIAELETCSAANNTTIEPLRPGSLPAGLNASNEQYGVASSRDVTAFDSRFGRYAPESRGNGLHVQNDFAGRARQDEHPEAVRAAQSELRGNPDAPASGSQDDLQRIKGVGPAIERTLNECGIFRFEQIADISEYDIDRIAKRLKGFRTRIYREDWIGQAQALRHPGS